MKAELFDGKVASVLNITLSYMSLPDTLTISFTLLSGDSKLLYADYDYQDSVSGEIQLAMNVTGLNSGSTSLYTSDSMNYIKRERKPLTKATESNYASFMQNENEIVGLNTFPSVDGFAMKETVKDSDYYFAISHSHSFAVSILNKPTDIGVLLTRNTYNNDDKGIVDIVVDKLPCSFYTAVFLSSGLSSFLKHKTLAYHELHNKFEVIEDSAKVNKRFSLFDIEFPAQVELISTKIMRAEENKIVVLIRVRNSLPDSIR